MHIFLAIPCGTPHIDPELLTIVSSCMNLKMTLAVQVNSALPHNFNLLWAEAVNGRPEYTHFAMVHSDVIPEAEFLSKLLHTMEEKNVDVVSTVIPLKSNTGLTSLAVDNDFWFPKRLTMKELKDLDSYSNLLFNTGCWIARLDRPWVEEVCFTFKTEMHKENGKLVAKFEPEDWAFSRFCIAKHIPYSITKNVVVRHMGTTAYPNQGEWGTWNTDKINVKK